MWVRGCGLRAVSVILNISLSKVLKTLEKQQVVLQPKRSFCDKLEVDEFWTYASEAVVFLNPSGRYVEVQSSVESPVRILSVGGELVLKSTTNTKMDAASLQSGLYLVQLPDGRLLKFVKQ